MKNPRIWNSVWAGGALLVLLTVAAYFPALRGGFIWDDDAYVTENAVLRETGGLWRIWSDVRSTPQYYPMVHTSFWLERRIWGLNPFGFHLSNVLLQAAAAIVLWRVLTKLALPGAWLAAAIFALHPVCVESVAWITERKNVLSAVFCFSAALAYLRFQDMSDRRVSGFGRWYTYLPALGLFVAALLSKTVTCSLPAVLLLIRWWKRGRLGWSDVIPLMPFFVAGIGLGLLTVWVEKHHVGAHGADWSLTFAERCLIAGRALWFYAGKLVWPVELTFIYPRWEIQPGLWWQWLFPLAALGVVITLWCVRNRIGRGPLVAVLIFAGVLFPALGFFNVYPMRYSFVADHFQYLACVGLIVPAAVLLSRAQFGLGVLVLLPLAVLTWNQTRIYRDVETLWTDTLTKNAGCWMARNNLGLHFTRNGRFDEAIHQFGEALRSKPDDAEILANLGGALTFTKDYARAIQCCEAAVAINPAYVEARANLGNALVATGRLDEALEQYQIGLRRKPDHAGLRKGLGTLWVAKGNLQEAEAQFREALTLRPEDAAAHDNLGSVLAMRGNLDEASNHLKRSVELSPHQPKTRFNYGNTLASRQDFLGAVEQYREAIRLSPNYAAAHKNLGISLARLGQVQEAETQLRKALQLDPNLVQAAQVLKSLQEGPK